MKGRACGGTSDLQRGFAVNMTPGFSCIFTFPASRHLGKRQVSVGYGLFHLSWWKLQFIHLKSGDKSGSSFFRIMRLPSLGWDGPVPCRMLSSIPGLYPLAVSSIPLVAITKMCPDMPNFPGEGGGVQFKPGRTSKFKMFSILYQWENWGPERWLFFLCQI